MNRGHAARTKKLIFRENVAPDDFLKVAIVGTPAADARPAYVATPEPGYIVYTGYAAALPAPSCYWTRMPVYDFDHNVIGWRGRPTAVCP